MALPARYAERELSIEVAEGDDVRLTWRGKSSDRDPGRFLVPIFAAVLARAREAKKAVVMDFAGVEYMNSSTFTPVVKMLNEAKVSGVTVALEYDESTKWQAVSFSALRAFETPDGRITIRSK
jgi:hypothetical protein